MNRQNNNIDIYIKTQLENTSIPFNKEKGWDKLENKRKQHKVHKLLSYSIAASILLALFFIIKPKHNTKPAIVNEFQKRQKLEEFEKKLSGTYIEIKFCFDCNGTIMKSKIKQVPEDPSLLIN